MISRECYLPVTNFILVDSRTRMRLPYSVLHQAELYYRWVTEILFPLKV